MLSDVVEQRLPFEILHHDKRSSGIFVVQMKLPQSNERRMVEVLLPFQLAKDGVDVTFEAIDANGFDNDIEVGFFVLAEKGDAKAARPEDANGRKLLKGKRLERILVERDRLLQRLQRIAPRPPFEGGPIDIVVSLGLRDRIADEFGDLLEVELALFEVTDDNFELSEAIEQRGEPSLLFGRQPSKAFDEILHDFAFVFASKREPIARLDGAGMEVMLPFQFVDGLIEVLEGLSMFMLFG